jgi:hypothetical protein
MILYWPKRSVTFARSLGGIGERFNGQLPELSHLISSGSECCFHAGHKKQSCCSASGCCKEAFRVMQAIVRCASRRVAGITSTARTPPKAKGVRPDPCGEPLRIRG